MAAPASDAPECPPPTLLIFFFFFVTASPLRALEASDLYSVYEAPEE